MTGHECGGYMTVHVCGGYMTVHVWNLRIWLLKLCGSINLAFR